MVKKIKLYNEFRKFLIESDINSFSEYEKKLVNLIISHFDEISEVGTSQGKRGKLLNELILNEGNKTSSELFISVDQISENTFPFDYLNHLEIENFRGFSNYEKICFNRKYTFIYGPNGSGKSSFCEALEYALLGYINEASLKRIPIEQYIINEVTGKFNPPILQGYNNNGELLQIKSNSSLYHFCFIEKSRIENFARISANTPNEKNNLLSILFGLTEFNEFVNEFTENIENYIDIEGKKNLELESKNASIKVHQDNIINEKKELKSIRASKSNIVNNTNIKNSFKNLDLYIHGNLEQKGRIKKIENELSKPQLIKYEIPTMNTLKCNLKEINSCLAIFKKYQSEYKEKKDEVKFKNLYDLVLILQPLSKDKCPVCETPVKDVVKHPYEKAQTKLNELQYITTLENNLEEITNDLSEKLEVFRKNLDKRIEVSKNFELKKPLKDIELKQLEFKGQIDIYANKLIEIYENTIQDHFALTALISKNNKKVKRQKIIRQKLFEEKENLENISKKIKEIKTIRRSKIENIIKWRRIIKNFKVENKQLIDDADKEKEQTKFNQKYVKAYHSLLKKLNNYKENLPVNNIVELNDLTLEFYNQINVHDKNFEMLERICLPSKIDEPIFIYFKNEPAKRYNALQILSEGHIRCLGLSILLAKNIQESYPVIIFDDIVNAIDDDHRGGIRTVLFENELLKSKQIILTTHANQFVKELEMHPSNSDYCKYVKKLKFLLDDNSRKIRIKYDDFENYLYKANKNYKEANYNEALYFCRCALENISNRLWKKIGSQKYRTEFSVVMRTPNSIPDLMSVVASLNKFLKNIDNNKYKTITDIFDFLICLKKNCNIIWEYLNKGTHDEPGKYEYDQLIVSKIIGKLIQLDNFVKCK